MRPATGTISVDCDLLLVLIDDVSRTRSLADDESSLLEEILNRGHLRKSDRITWTKDMDRKLVRAARSKLTLREWAAKNNIGAQAAYDRLHKLRKAKYQIPDLRFKNA